MRRRVGPQVQTPLERIAGRGPRADKRRDGRSRERGLGRAASTPWPSLAGCGYNGAAPTSPALGKDGISPVRDGERGDPKVAFVVQALGLDFPSFKDLYREGASHWLEREDVPGDVVITFGAGTGVVWLPESRGEYHATARFAKLVFLDWSREEREARARAKMKTG